MHVYEMIIRQRLLMADLFEGLTQEQANRQSLCDSWTIHEVAAHLTTFLRLAQPKLYLGVLVTAGNIDRVNLELTRRAARRPMPALIQKLRALAGSRVTVPRSGFDPVLTDLVLHELDVRVPLGLPGRLVPERAIVALDHLAKRPVPGFTVGDRLADLRLVATDLGWTHGDGQTVRGDSEALLLAMGGRGAGMKVLEGEGVELLRERLHSRTKAKAHVRMQPVIKLLLGPRPPAAERTLGRSVDGF
jgi:uncharacterized protein (TIGR03083 family)